MVLDWKHRSRNRHSLSDAGLCWLWKSKHSVNYCSSNSLKRKCCLRPTCQTLSSGQTGSREEDPCWYWLSNLLGSWPLLCPISLRIQFSHCSRPGLDPWCWSACMWVYLKVPRNHNIFVCYVCVWRLNKSYVCAKANRFVPDVPGIHPIKPSEPIENLHYKDGILSHLTVQVLRSESPQSRTNCRFNKEPTHQNAAVCWVVTIKASAPRCVWAKTTLICQGWKAQQRNMFFKTLPCNSGVFNLSFFFSLQVILAPKILNKIRLVNLKLTPQFCITRGLLRREGMAGNAINWSFPPKISELMSWKLSHPDEVCVSSKCG